MEVSIYLEPNNIGSNYGSKLYAILLKELRTLDVHLVIGGMTLPNIASQNLHEKFGFIKVAHFSEVGYKFDQWLDVGYWELHFK